MLPVTLESASTAFRSLGLNGGEIVELHGSLKAIGLVSGGPNTICDALLQVLSHEGTLIMSAQYSTNSDPAHWEHPPVDIEAFEIIRESHPPYLGKATVLAWMGSLAQALQLKDDTEFSDHPSMAVMAHGKQGKWLTMDAPLTPAFGLDSPYHKAIQLKAKVLLIGVDYDRITGMHVAEALSKKRPYIVESATILQHGHNKRIKFLDYDYDSDVFKVIGAEFEKKHNVPSIMLGNATCKLIDLNTLHDFTLAYFKEHL